MRKSIFLIALLTSAYAQMPTDKAFQKLVDGNQRFVQDRSTHPNRTAERREETAASQEPFAVIVGCSDSRVAPEILFDQGIGDLFIVRVAGNVVGPIELASIEYSAIYLHSAVVVVLGHENCGAVKAVLAGQTKDIEPVAALIQPAADKTAKMTGDRLESTVKENVALVVKQLQANPALQKLIAEKKLLIKGGYYNFHSGQVEFN